MENNTMQENPTFIDKLTEWAKNGLTKAIGEIDKIKDEKRHMHPQIDVDLLSQANEELFYLKGKRDTFYDLFKNISAFYMNKNEAFEGD